MKDVVLLFGMGLLILSLYLLKEASEDRSPILLAVGILVESFIIMYHGIRMSLVIQDIRITAIMMILGGQLLWWHCYNPWNDMSDVGKAIGIIAFIMGCLWAKLELIYTPPHPKTWRNSL